MSRRRAWIAGAVLWWLAIGVMGQDQGGAAPPAQEPAPAAEPEKPPRVVGEAQTPEEWEAWQLVEQAPSLQEKAQLAQAFLAKYPESGLTAHAHHLLARQYYQAGDMTNFVPHAEKAIAELPQAVDMLSGLAFFYAEKGQPDRAIDRANRALQAVESASRPAEVSAADWVSQLYQIRAEANYALGRAHLSKIARSENRAEDPNLIKAVQYLETALKYDPRHDYACFRLGFALRNRNDAGGALLAYGRAIAIGGVAAGPAQQQLEEVLGIVKNAMPDSEWAKKSAQDVVAAAAGQLQQELARVQSEQAALVQTIQAQEAQGAPAPAPGPTAPQPPPGR
jgi:tetratricopeptide (TPR) repeat protein